MMVLDLESFQNTGRKTPLDMVENQDSGTNTKMTSQIEIIENRNEESISCMDAE